MCLNPPTHIEEVVQFKMGVSYESRVVHYEALPGPSVRTLENGT